MRHARLALVSLFSIALWLAANASAAAPAPAPAPVPVASSSFEQANKKYEEGAYRDAAALYETLVAQGHPTSAVYFNLGNAWFKAGQTGRAIASYLAGQRLDPRDPSLRFNLQFARKKATGSDSPPGTWWRRWLLSLTLNEWSVLFGCAFWLWFSLLCLRELRASLRKTLGGYTAAAAAAALILGLMLAGAFRQWNGPAIAVVAIPEAVVRYGPLDESQVFFQLPDGTEVTVVDRKTGEQSWVQIRDATGREGWLKSSEIIVLEPPSGPPPGQNKT